MLCCCQFVSCGKSGGLEKMLSFISSCLEQSTQLEPNTLIIVKAKGSSGGEAAAAGAQSSSCPISMPLAGLALSLCMLSLPRPILSRCSMASADLAGGCDGAGCSSCWRKEPWKPIMGTFHPILLTLSLPRVLSKLISISSCFLQALEDLAAFGITCTGHTER